MLNKELLMAVGADLEPVLSIYLAPENSAPSTVRVRLYSGDVIEVTGQETERKAFKLSELDLNANILIRYDTYLATLTTKNLVNLSAKAEESSLPALYFRIEDITQSASIVIK